MIDYKEELNKIRFNFRPEEIIDYETLVSLIGSIMGENKFEEYKEEVFHTIQIIVLIYGLDEQLETTNFNFNPAQLNLDDINLWKYLIIHLYNILVATSELTLDENSPVKDEYYIVLQALSQRVDGELLTTALEERENGAFQDEIRDGMVFDNTPYEYVEPNQDKYNFDQTPNNDMQQPVVLPPFQEDAMDLNGLKWDYLEKYVLINNIIPYRCEICGNSEWQHKPIPLRLTCKNTNLPNINEKSNLMYICPNCDAQIAKE